MLNDTLVPPPGPVLAPRHGTRWGFMAMLAGVAMLFVLFAGGLVLIPRYQATHPVSTLQRSDADTAQIDDLYLDLTLVTPDFLQNRKLDRYLGGRDPATVLPVLVGVNTHTGSIEHLHHLHGNFFLVGPDGRRFPSLTSPIVLSQHHNAYLVLFPSRGGRGEPFLSQQAGTLVVEAIDVGATPLRRFEWHLPVTNDLLGLRAGQELLPTLILTVALVGALLVVLSPCALELTLYYSAIIACTVSASARTDMMSEQVETGAVGRRRLLLNLTSFVAGFTLLYATAGATVGLIGEGVRQPLGAYSEIIQIIAGSLILFFALRVLGVDRYLTSWLPIPTTQVRGHERPGSWWSSRLSRPRMALARLRMRGHTQATAPGGMRTLDSFLVGVGLSTSCLTCMGGAVLYPLLVYAGITSWYSGLMTLGLYSLGIAVPMVFIALGFFQIRLSLVKRLRFTRMLRTASGVMLTGIGLLILSGNERIMTDLTFHLLGEIFRWFA